MKRRHCELRQRLEEMGRSVGDLRALGEVSQAANSIPATNATLKGFHRPNEASNVRAISS